MAYIDQLDSYRQPLTFMRFLMTFGFTYLLMGAMICIGVWFPVRKAVRTAPAEALHYE
jgi:ABC-type lipoprotein release transport system permease subunit